MIDIKKTFLKLTKKRYPHGTEDDSMVIIKSILPNVNFKKDEFGNYYTNVLKKDGTNSDTMFTSHIDTIDSGPIGYTSDGKVWDTELKKYIYDPNAKIDDKSVKHIFDGDFIKTDGNSNLGADDKAGTTIMLNMISENIPGLYYFFIGEESGCIGSSNLSRVFEDKIQYKINKCISFDRRGYESIITHQSTGVCCSDEFANGLCELFNEYGFWFEPDFGGIYTDSAEFVDIIPECTNISVGYFNEHTKTEKQDIEFLELLSKVCVVIDWDNLPIVRQCDNVVYTGKKSKRHKRYYGMGYGSWDWDDDFNDNEYFHRHNNFHHTTDTSFDDDIDDININDSDFDFDKWYNEQKSKLINA